MYLNFFNRNQSAIRSPDSGDVARDDAGQRQVSKGYQFRIHLQPVQLTVSSRHSPVQFLPHLIPLQHAVVPVSTDVVGSIDGTSSTCGDRFIRSRLHLVLLPQVIHV
jgi:hypothetical protein